MLLHRAAIAVGPKAAGKTTFCQSFVAGRSDAILIRSNDNDVFTGEGILWRTIAQNLRTNADKDAQFILDCHCCNPEQRKEIVTRLHTIGIADVEAWHFVTPEFVCVKWFTELDEREERALTDPRDRKWRALFRPHTIKAIHREYAAFPIPTVQEGFSRIRSIDPRSQHLRIPCH